MNCSTDSLDVPLNLKTCIPMFESTVISDLVLKKPQQVPNDLSHYDHLTSRAGGVAYSDSIGDFPMAIKDKEYDDFFEQNSLSALPQHLQTEDMAGEGVGCCTIGNASIQPCEPIQSSLSGVALSTQQRTMYKGGSDIHPENGQEMTVSAAVSVDPSTLCNGNIHQSGSSSTASTELTSANCTAPPQVPLAHDMNSHPAAPPQVPLAHDMNSHPAAPPQVPLAHDVNSHPADPPQVPLAHDVNSHPAAPPQVPLAHGVNSRPAAPPQVPLAHDVNSRPATPPHAHDVNSHVLVGRAAPPQVVPSHAIPSPVVKCRVDPFSKSLEEIVPNLSAIHIANTSPSRNNDGNYLCALTCCYARVCCISEPCSLMYR